MGAITTQVYKSMESYWRHRNYKRLEESPERKKREVRLGDGRRSHRRVKVARLAFRIQYDGFRRRKEEVTSIGDEEEE
ncbi:hypothetical protein DsansV1_C38g0234651 [Dioscorea sansibarensis]